MASSHHNEVSELRDTTDDFFNDPFFFDPVITDVTEWAHDMQGDHGT
jgi:hypothetical protein